MFMFICICNIVISYYSFEINKIKLFSKIKNIYIYLYTNFFNEN